MFDIFTMECTNLKLRAMCPVFLPAYSYACQHVHVKSLRSKHVMEMEENDQHVLAPAKIVLLLETLFGHLTFDLYMLFSSWKIWGWILFSVRTLRRIAQKMVILRWNFSVDPCNSGGNGGFGGTVNCDCSFYNHTFCHVTNMYAVTLDTCHISNFFTSWYCFTGDLAFWWSYNHTWLERSRLCHILCCTNCHLDQLLQNTGRAELHWWAPTGLRRIPQSPPTVSAKQPMQPINLCHKLKLLREL